jgi:HK97 family phage prohead protease
MLIENLDAELRAKYSAEELTKMVSSGTAMKSEGGDPVYPIADVHVLRDSIRLVGRGSDEYDGIRRHIVTRSTALGHSDLVPDNWNSDGSLNDAKGAWSTLEERETYGDLMVALDDFLQEESGSEWACWVQDIDAANGVFYYSQNGLLYSRTFALSDEGPLTVGAPERVRPVTSYVSTERDAGVKPENRRANKTLEWRRHCAETISEVQRKRPSSRQVIYPIEIRSDNDDGPIILRSYASLFDTGYTIGGGSYRYEERVDAGAFTRTLSSDPDVVFRTEHSSLPLARTSSGTLTLGEDDKGLWYEAQLDRADPDVISLVPKIQRGDLRESSFAFRCIRDKWSEDRTKRNMQEVDIHRGDVSVVTFGASADTGRHLTMRYEDQLKALRNIGAEAFIAAWVEWRNWTLLSMDARAGAKFSSANRETLQQVLGLVAGADDNVDEALVILSDLMDVPNPNEDAEDDADTGSSEETLSEPTEVEAPEKADPEVTPPTPEAPTARYDELEAEFRAMGGQ